MSNQRLPRSIRRSSRRSAVVLAVGAIIAVAASVGGAWPARAGVLIAVAAGVAALVLATNRARRVRQLHGEQLVTISRAQRDQVRELRAHHRGVVDSLSAANTHTRRSVASLTRRLGQLGAELSSLRRDRVALAERLAKREAAIVALHTQLHESEVRVETLEALLAQLDAQARAGLEFQESHPIDVEVGPNAGARVAEAPELFSDGEHPTVVELRVRPVLDPEFAARRRA